MRVCRLCKQDKTGQRIKICGAWWTPVQIQQFTTAWNKLSASLDGCVPDGLEEDNLDVAIALGLITAQSEYMDAKTETYIQQKVSA